jgi:hypothetical protein
MWGNILTHIGMHHTKSERLVIFLSACIEGILRLLPIFYLHRKFSIFLRNDHDCKAVEGLNIFEKLL